MRKKNSINSTADPATCAVSNKKTRPLKGQNLGNSRAANPSSGDEISLQDNLNKEQIAEQKRLMERARKARNQRKYYETHKAVQQEKARDRAAKNRLAKRQLWTPTADDGYDDPEDYIPTLIPVFDPAFVSTATVNHAMAPSDTPISSDTAIDIAQQAALTAPPTLPTAHEDPREDHTPYPDLSSETSGHGAIDFGDWESLTAPRRIAAVRRWIMHAVRTYGPVECWAEDLGEQWRAMGDGDTSAVHNWLDGVKRRIRMGRNALSYLETAMEGDLSASVEEWRDLYAQSHQLACQLYIAVLGIQYKLDSVIAGQRHTQTQLKFNCM